MENRERDRVSQRTSSTEAGELNRRTEEEKGRRETSGTNAEFGKSIGRSENLSEGGEMNRNRNQDEVTGSRSGNPRSMENETSRRSDQGSYGSSSGRRSGSLGSESDVSRDRDSSSSSGSRDRDRDLDSSSDIGDSSRGRH
jgi:hypothetical protein